jgi:regulator of cell morphogenesis and NO signaling
MTACRSQDLFDLKKGRLMMLSLNKTVRDLAIELPQATRVFERLKIDYCCGGDKPLGEACATAGVEVAILERMLDEAGQTDTKKNGSVDVQTATLSELIDHIVVKHHVYAKDEMARLELLLEKVFTAHGENHPELRDIGQLFRTLCADLRPHMFKEERILFPYIVDLEKSVLQSRAAPFAPFGTVNNPVRMMMMEHDAAGDILRKLRILSSNFTVPPDGCISYATLYQALEAFELDLHQHIHLENNILFPGAVGLEASVM